MNKYLKVFFLVGLFILIGVSSCQKETTTSSILESSSIEPDTYRLVFDTLGGTFVPTQTIIEGETLKEVETPAKAGYEFKGWLYENKPFDLKTPITKHMILTANWGVDSDIIEILNIFKDENYTLRINLKKKQNSSNIEKLLVKLLLKSII